MTYPIIQSNHKMMQIFVNFRIQNNSTNNTNNRNNLEAISQKFHHFPLNYT